MTTEKGFGTDQESARGPLAGSTTTPARDENSALSALVDEKVFGHRVAWRGNFAYRADVLGDTQIRDLVADCYALHAVVPDYSTEITAAWLVVEAMHDAGWWIDIEHDTSGFLVTMEPFEPEDLRRVELRDDTAPLAICRAALVAVEAP